MNLPNKLTVTRLVLVLVFAVFAFPYPDCLGFMNGGNFFADIKEHVDDNLVSNEGLCKWFPLEETGSLEMPLSAKYIMNHFRETGRRTDKTYICAAGADKGDILELPES